MEVRSDRMSKLISIVIPCYNVEAYLDRCLTSLVNQTIGVSQLELILVDDASSDGTWEKLLNWEQQYSESIIIIQHEKNMKQGAARNTGLQYASAPYIGFVDSDDWVDVTMFEKLYQAAEEFHTDVAGCLALRALSELEEGKAVSSEPMVVHYDSEENKKLLMRKGFLGFVVCFIYHRELIYDNQIMFPEYISYEDNYWKDILKLYINSSVILQEELYYYYVNENSTTMSRNSMAYMDRLLIEERKVKTYQELGILALYHQEIEYSFTKIFFVNTIYMIISRCNDFPLSMFSYMKRKLKEYFPSYLQNEYLKKELSCTDQSILKLAEQDYSQAELNQIRLTFQDNM